MDIVVDEYLQYLVRIGSVAIPTLFPYLAGSLPNANAGAGQCTHMAARVGLLPHAILVSSRALPTPRARVPYPLPPVPSYLRHASRSCRASPRFVAVRAMASGNPYAAELAAAKKAVTLAAKLCQVRGYRGPAAVRCGHSPVL